jgi:hypothetical protein
VRKSRSTALSARLALASRGTGSAVIEHGGTIAGCNRAADDGSGASFEIRRPVIQ